MPVALPLSALLDALARTSDLGAIAANTYVAPQGARPAPEAGAAPGRLADPDGGEAPPVAEAPSGGSGSWAAGRSLAGLRAPLGPAGQSPPVVPAMREAATSGVGTVLPGDGAAARRAAGPAAAVSMPTLPAGSDPMPRSGQAASPVGPVAGPSAAEAAGPEAPAGAPVPPTGSGIRAPGPDGLAAAEHRPEAAGAGTPLPSAAQAGSPDRAGPDTAASAAIFFAAGATTGIAAGRSRGGSRGEVAPPPERAPESGHGSPRADADPASGPGSAAPDRPPATRDPAPIDGWSRTAEIAAGPQVERAGIIASFILNAAMIPGWPPPRPFAPPAAETLLAALVQAPGSTEAALEERLGRQVPRPGFLARMRALLGRLMRSRRLQVLLGLAILLDAIASIEAELADLARGVDAEADDAAARRRLSI